MEAKTVDGRGGARPGAGRPRLEATKFREALHRELEARAEKLAKVIADKAEEGDIPAWREFVDRVVGRPVQQMDHTTNGKDLPSPILLGATPEVLSDAVPSDDGAQKDTGTEKTS
jgi:hypothetical protein